MKQSWQIGSLFGIPIRVDASWFVIVALATVANGLAWQSGYPDWAVGVAWGTGLAMALLLFGSVLLHELGHSLVALSQGTKVNSITLFLFGGLAAIDEEGKTPGKTFQVAIAGPLVSLGLFLVLRLLAQNLSPDQPLEVLAQNLADLNLVLALFNLIPGLPLDGGQILKAAVWYLTGDRLKGVHWAATVGRSLGWFAVIIGSAILLLLGDYSGLWLALIGWFILRNATSYDRFADLQEALLKLQAESAMTRNFRVVNAEMPLTQFTQDYLEQATPSSAYFAASAGRYRGRVQPEILSQIERSQWDTLTVQALVQPLSVIPTVQQTTSLPEVIHQLEAFSLEYITVLSPAGAVAGVIDRGDIVRALTQQLGVQVPEATIQRIKTEGQFPPDLQLQTVAEALQPQPAVAKPASVMDKL